MNSYFHNLVNVSVCCWKVSDPDWKILNFWFWSWMTITVLRNMLESNFIKEEISAVNMFWVDKYNFHHGLMNFICPNNFFVVFSSYYGKVTELSLLLFIVNLLYLFRLLYFIFCYKGMRKQSWYTFVSKVKILNLVHTSLHKFVLVSIITHSSKNYSS